MILPQKQPWYKVSVRFLLISFCIIYMIMPIVQRTVSTFLTTYFYLAVIVWLLFSIVFAQGRKTFYQYMSLLFPFILFFALTFVTNNESVFLWGYDFILFLLPVVMGYYVINYRKHEVKRYAKIIITAIGITIITTIIGLARYPMASRIMATISSTQDERVVLYNWNNIGGYEFIYILVLVYPLIILAYKQRKIKLWLALLVSAFIGLTIISSEYTTALLLFILTSVLFLLRRELTAKELVVFAVVGLTSIVIFSNFVSISLRWLGNSLESIVLSERLNALAGGTIGMQNFESNRFELYKISLQTFLKNPLFGSSINGGYGSGGHSQIFDSLAKYGIVGGVLLFWIYRYIYIYFLKPFKNQKSFGYVLWFYIQTIFLSAINTLYWMEVLTLFVPVILCLIYNVEEEK